MLSGTDERSEPPVQGGGCPCGRAHPSPGFRQRRLRISEDGLPVKAYEALVAGKAVQDGQGFWWLQHAGNCIQPITMSAHNHESRLIAKRLVRCRRCVECLHARRYYWAMAALEQTRLAKRTWFGTLTLSSASQAEMLTRARFNSREPNAEYWDDPACDARFLAVRKELILECRRMWARLRAAGHKFKYFLVFERHKSGLPHMHYLLHEVEAPILKRAQEAQWPWGFTAIKIVGGHSKQSVPPEKAAWYVAKYLSKSEQSRQIASKGYRPEKRPLPGQARQQAERDINVVEKTRDDVTRTTRDEYPEQNEILETC